MKLIVPFLILLLLSCKKQITSNKIENKSFGFIDDNPERVKKIPLLASSEFLKSKQPQILSQSAKGKPDATPPTISITYPTQGQVLDTGIVIVTVAASDNVAVKSVILRVNGTRIDSLLTAPYSFSWRNTSLAGTSPTLLATARDAAGNWASYSITVVVNPVPPPPLPPSYTGMATPTPMNQGNEGSCSSCAVGYGAKSIEQYYRTGASIYSYSTNIFSPEYLYDQVHVGDCGGGSSITGNLDFIYNLGVTTWAGCPYSDVNGCSITPTQQQIDEAALYKIPNYGRVTNTDRIMIKNMVIAHHPVITGINIDANFINAQPGYTWNSIGTGNAPHAIIVIGYDDSRNAYLTMNSFGTTWGDGGFLWVDYSIYEQRAGFYSYVMNY